MFPNYTGNTMPAKKVFEKTVPTKNWYGFYWNSLMTFKQFKYLSEDDQESLLWRKGVELARKSDTFYNYILFQVDGFYMELQYVMPQRNIVRIACFEDTTYLEPYLRNIDIGSLYTV